MARRCEPAGAAVLMERDQAPWRILLVEDDADHAELTREALRLMEGPPSAVRWERSYEDAAAAIEAEPFDLWLVDYRLGAHTGLDLLALAPAREPRPPVIVLTAIGDRAADQAAMAAGAADYLVKDQITPPLLERAVRHALLRARAEAARSQAIRAETARAEAEAAQRRLSFLAAASELLASTLDAASILASVPRIAVPFLAAYCAVVAADSDGTLHCASALQREDASASRAERRIAFPSKGAPPALAAVIDGGGARRWERPSPRDLAALIVDPREREALGGAGLAQLWSVPLAARGRPFGALIVGSRATVGSNGGFDEPLVEELARRAANALDNAFLYAQAKEAIADRDEFLSVAAHELRTPVAALRGFAQLAMRQLDRRGGLDPARTRMVLEELEGQTAKLTRLVGQLLDISRLDAGKLVVDRAPADLTAVVHSAVRIARAWGTAQRLIVTAPHAAPAVVDALRLEQVVTNLLDNAFKFSPAGGVVQVTVTPLPPGRWQITVRDEGVGVPPDARTHIFARYSQGQRGGNFWGLGLGLFISRQIAELHGGALEIAPADGPGATFVLTVPAGALRGGLSVDGARSVANRVADERTPARSPGSD